MDDRYESNKKFDLQKTFMNVIVAAGKNFEVEPFSSIEIPRNQDFRDSDDQQFKSDLDHYITQLVLSNSTRARGLSAEISTSSKDKVKAYVNGLRHCIENENMSAPRKKALLRKLEEFELELDRRRTSFVSLSLLAIAFASAPGATWDSVEVVNKLVSNITNVFAEAKQAEDQTRRIVPDAAPKVLSPPRHAKDTIDKRPSWDGPSLPELDDDIPF